MFVFSLEFWIILLLVTVILELLINTFYLLSIASGSLAALILNYYHFDTSMQILAFIVVSLLFVIITRPLAAKVNDKNSKKSNTDRFIGKQATVTRDINSDKPGQVMVDNELWLASSDEYIKENQMVNIIGVDGNKLIVKKNSD